MKYEHDLVKLHERMVSNKIRPWSDEDIRFLALAMVGEAGEVANEIKKDWRGDDVPVDRIATEIGDTLVYLMLLRRALGVSEERCLDLVLQKLESRPELGLKRTCPYPGCPTPFSAKPPCALCYE